MTIRIHTAMNQVQPLNGDHRTGHITSSHMTSSQATKTFVKNSSQSRDRVVGEMALCLSRQDAPHDM